MIAKYLILLLITITASFDVFAGEVYKTVDKDGNVVFSDKKTQDAETINVQPNVVDLDIPEMPASTTQNKSNKQISNYPKAAQPEVSGWNTTNNGNVRRRVRTETNGEGISRNNSTVAPGRRTGGR